MTISSTASAETLLGNGATSVWAYAFIADSANNIQVSYTNAVGVSTILTPSQYTLTINAPAVGSLWGVGGTLTYPTSGPAIPSGTSLTIRRVLPLQQLTTISDQGPFNPQVIETAMDTLCMEIQQVSARTGQICGVWAPGVAYGYGDIVVDGANGANTGNLYICAIANTSAVWVSDLAAGDWSLALNVANIIAEVDQIGLVSLTNIAALRANTAASGIIFVQGYYAAGDAGGGYFWLSSDFSSADNGGTIIVDAAGHRYKRALYPYQISTVQAQWFGFIGNGSSNPLSGHFSTLAAAQAIYPFAASLTNETDGVAIQAAIYAISPFQTYNPTASPNQGFLGGGTVIIPSGKWYFNETIYVSSQVSLTSFATPVPGSTLALVDPSTNFTSATGACVGCWTGSTQGIGLDATGFYASINNSFTGAIPALTGTATGGSAQSGYTNATITFNASAVAGIGANTFAGGVITLTGGTGATNTPRLILSGAYNSGTGIYTASVLDPWNNGVPDNTTTFSIAAIATGARFTAVEGCSGANTFAGGNGSSPFQITLTEGVNISNITLVADNGGYAPIRLNGAPSSTVSNCGSAGWNLGIYVNASYYSSIRDSNFSAHMVGVAHTEDSWMLYDNVKAFAAYTAGASSIYAPSSTNRPWFIGQSAAAGADPNPYLATGLCATGGFLTWLGGDLGEDMDRGGFIADTNSVFLGAYMEGIGRGAGQKTGNCGLYIDGAQVNWTGGGWYGIYTSPYVPMFTGANCFLTVNNLSTQSGSDTQFIGTFNFTFGGKVILNNVVPGAGDAAPTAPNITWDGYANTWTPTITLGGGSTTASAATGTYTISGKQVVAEFDITLSSLNGHTGGLSIGGLPIAPHATVLAGGGVSYIQNAASGLTQTPAMAVAPSQTYFGLYKITAGNSVQLLDTDITSTFRVAGTLVYQTA